ncbi:4-hydroxybenzoate octaprenyltransferase [Bacteroidota bacterium]|nr:4-hydroxybenzoate octaprenyltransferase [Bacteroidota bacterium]
MKKYFSFIKFSHTVFALPFAVIGYFLAISKEEYFFSWKIFLLVVACMVCARSAAMGFNRFADRMIDAKNPRTATREIPAGKISSTSAFVFVLFFSFLFVVITWFINPLCFYLSPIALIVVLGYSYTKRFTPLAHLFLGLGLSLAPIGAYLAVTGTFSLLPVLFSFVVMSWVSGFDIIYALQDEEFDRKEKLFSIPVWLGKKNALTFSRCLHLISASVMLIAGYSGNFGISYWIGAFIFIMLLIYQQKLVRPEDLSKVNIAFATTNGIASIVFSIFVLTDLYLK